MKLRGLIAVLMFSNFLTQMARSETKDADTARLIKACPEAYYDDDMYQTSIKLNSVRNTELKGDPRADAKVLCKKHTLVVQLFERQTKLLKSCLPTTEPLVKKEMLVNIDIQISAVEEMIKLGCKD